MDAVGMYISVSFAFYAPCVMSPLQHMSVSLGIWSLGTSATAAFMHIPHASYTHPTLENNTRSPRVDLSLSPYMRRHLPYRCFCPAS